MNFKVKSKNRAVLNDFIEHCVSHPDERFWQALRNWSDNHMILIFNASKLGGLPENQPENIKDTFYFEGKDY